ncbi:MAG: aminotransferase class III-fold pyridoxal phosphate-dependent enzyme [Solobacterium sp.]|nr:aminotransferase class III-fold pyridoxal phosphate-dependent enzyme [Solobacterium sp.]
MSTIRQLDETYIAKTYGRFPVTLVSGKGSVALDEAGNEYIDLGSGIAVNLFGYSDDVWKEAVIAQLNTLQHTSNLYYTGPCAKLAEELCTRTGMKKVFYCNSGAEANECAIKAARRWGQLHKGDDCYTIITLKDSFHGRTLTTLAATGQDAFHQLFLPLTPGFVHAEAGNIESVKELVKKHRVCAVMIECVQGEGGVNALDRQFVKDLVQLAEEEHLLIIDDEVQTGNGRTGTLYAYMQYGFTPDIVTTAKGIGGGLPIGVTMLGEKVQDIFHPGDNGSTFGGNPAVCAGALSNLQRLDDAMLKEVQEKAAWIRSELENAPGVAGLSGLGLMVGIEPVHAKAADIAAKCLAKGVLVLTAKGNKVRLLPALNIPDEILKKGIGVLKEVLAEE